jgi:hypothetical protein
VEQHNPARIKLPELRVPETLEPEIGRNRNSNLLVASQVAYKRSCIIAGENLIKTEENLL